MKTPFPYNRSRLGKIGRAQAKDVVKLANARALNTDRADRFFTVKDIAVRLGIELRSANAALMQAVKVDRVRQVFGGAYVAAHLSNKGEVV